MNCSNPYVTEGYIKDRMKKDGLQVTKIHGLFVGYDYVKVSVAFFEMELDTAIIVYRIPREMDISALYRELKYSHLQLVDVHLLD